MDQRRYFRYVFPLVARPSVELECAAWPHPLRGEVLDISGGGMLVRAADWSTPFCARQAVTVRCQLPHGGPHLVLAAEVVHHRAPPDGVYCGIHFVPASDPLVQRQREALLLHFITEEQRRQLRDYPAMRTE